MTRLWSVIVCLALLPLAACTSIGPTTIPRDRFDYSAALAESWKNQMLLNLVKMRYLDLPIYLEVGQVVSGYTLETGASVGGQIGNSAAGTNFLELGTTGRYIDRPTITYMPLTGAKYLEGFLTPIEMTKVLALIQAGFDAGFILELSVESLNGLRNQSVSMGSKYKADAGFFRALTLLREIQDAGAVGLRSEEGKDGRRGTYLFFRKDGIHPEYQVVTATCACGNSFQTRSTRKELAVDICNQCHPFYTGKQRLVDTAGRIDRFRRKYGQSAKNA